MLKILLTTPAMVTTQVVIWLLVVTLLVITPAFAGDKEFKRCKSCHSIEQDGKNKIGPNLWNIFNRGTAQNQDYKYSKKFRAWAEENPVWTPELMDQWLTKSTKLVKGTKMRFREKKQEKRAATIVYLQSMQEVEK
jgi:cytochrome c|tara:strand:+ start:1195 stop:1602 length:408 start_codon:yes stop_codon:yes gene_type:complete